MNVLGSDSFLDVPDVNGVLVLTANTGVTSVSGTTNEITVSGSVPNLTVGLADNPIVPGLASLTVPMGTTAQRPTAADGMIRYNSTLDRMEISEASQWLTSAWVMDKSTVPQTVAAAGPTTIFTYSVPANVMNADGILKLSMQGWWNPGAARTMTMAVTFGPGPTATWQATSPSMASGNRAGWELELFLTSNNSASSQALTGNLTIGPIGTPTQGTTGTITATSFANSSIFATSAINTAAAATTFSVAVTFSGATAGFVKQFHVLQKM